MSTFKDINTYYSKAEDTFVAAGDPERSTSNSTSAKRGRPKKSKGQHLITVYMDDELYAQVMQVVESTYGNKANIARMLIRKGLEQLEKE